MSESESAEGRDPIAANLYAATSGDGPDALVEASGLSQAELTEITELMNALVNLRHAEQVLSDASHRYMKLSAQDMRAVHYLMVAKRQREIVTPGMLGRHLQISPASITKLLNRLERGGHVIRRVHPVDRRAFALEITPETEASARQTVGRQQARRFYAAARLTSAERGIVTRFLNDMAAEIAVDDVEWANVADG